MINSRTILRACVPAGVLLVGLAAAAPASAHVHVHSDDASAGGYGQLVFRVPTESDTASTVKVSIELPADKPFASVSAMPKPGWKISTKKTKFAKPVKAGDFTLSEAVTTVTWTATKAGLAPGEFDEFDLSVGPFPKAGTDLMFNAAQAYSDGSVVNWDEPTPASGSEPEHPAPSVKVAAASGGHAGDPAAPTSETRADSGGTDTVGRATGVAALVVALAALGFAVRRRPRPDAVVK